MATDQEKAAEAEEHARAVFARMTANRRLPTAQRARGQRITPASQRGDRSTVQGKAWRSGVDSAVPNGDKD
jgi:hypothetical protein